MDRPSDAWAKLKSVCERASTMIAEAKLSVCGAPLLRSEWFPTSALSPYSLWAWHQIKAVTVWRQESGVEDDRIID